jgi:succinate dehydrogenase hydrophobic anchor subunit
MTKAAVFVRPTYYLSTTADHNPSPSRLHGSYHWLLERALNVSLVGLIPAAFMVSHPGIDYALGVVLPLHCHLGLMQVITDYVPKHKFPIIHRVTSNGLRLTTLLTLYGLYLLNSQDIGITATVAKLWFLHRA